MGLGRTAISQALVKVAHAYAHHAESRGEHDDADNPGRSNNDEWNVLVLSEILTRPEPEPEPERGRLTQRWSKWLSRQSSAIAR